MAYVGPFRVGPVVVHEHFSRVFHRTAMPAAGAATPPAPFYAEIVLTAEPNLLATQLGPLRRLEAVDDAGQSLLDPKLGGEAPASLSAGMYGPPRVLTIPLVRPANPSKLLATLRGALPLEVARRPTAPTLVVPLEGSIGKTVRDGDLAVTVREYRIDPRGQATVKLTIRLEGPRAAADPSGGGWSRRGSGRSITSRSGWPTPTRGPSASPAAGPTRAVLTRPSSTSTTRSRPSAPRGPSHRRNCGFTGPRGSPGTCRWSSATSRSPDRSGLARSRPCRPP